jgi:hypothetical protein
MFQQDLQKWAGPWLPQNSVIHYLHITLIK